MSYEVRRDADDPGCCELFWVSDDAREEDFLLSLRDDELPQLALVLMQAVLPSKEEER